MNHPLAIRRVAAIALAAGISMLLSACLLSPGKFVSNLELYKDGRFSFAYTGQVSMLGLTKLAAMGRKGDQKFEASTCYKDDNETERACTPAELDKQKADWEQEQKEAAAKAKKDAEEAKMIFGGIDPTSPQAAEEMAERLRKQAGWKSVVYKGDGLYEVDFAISGRIDHDFAFPTIERFPMANAFVVVNRRADGAVRVDAPGFGPSSGGAGMGGLAQLAALGAKKEGKDINLPEMDGIFTVVTNGTILANNTDDGPKAGTSGLAMTWKVNPRTGAAPTALIKLGN